MIRKYKAAILLLLLAAGYNAYPAGASDIGTGKETYRVLFIGTSQTWGAGAKTREETFVKLIEKRLNEQADKPGKFTCINAGVSGSDSTGLAEYYTNNWIKVRPIITIVNLSSNDTDEKAFYSNLQQFVRINEQNNIKTVFVVEANSPEESQEESGIHKIMKRVGKENNLLVIDLHKYLRGKYDDGLVWWDYVHLTSFGHKLAAAYIFENLWPYLKSIPETKR